MAINIRLGISLLDGHKLDEQRGYVFTAATELARRLEAGASD